MTLPIALSIAGSDSGGGAGIQADLKTFHAFGCFGTTAITAITAQNTQGVRAIHAVPSDVVRAQIDAIADDLPPDAFKTGMLATRELVQLVATSIGERGLERYVLDPVMVATSGDRLLDAEAERAVTDDLLPLCAVVTPNLHEASILTGETVESMDQMLRAAEKLVQMGAGAALVKGGHLAGDELLDVLYDGDAWREWRRPRLPIGEMHGTGCTLSAGIAAGLAHGRPLQQAVEDALEYLQRALKAAPGLGGGHGPVNHMVEGPSAEHPAPS